MNYISIYNGDVTDGNKDGNVIDNVNTIFAFVTTGKETVQDLAVRCSDNFAVLDNAELSLVGTTAECWCFEVDGVKYEWGQSVTIAGVTDKNKVFKMHATALPTESPSVNQSVEVRITATVQAV